MSLPYFEKSDLRPFCEDSSTKQQFIAVWNDLGWGRYTLAQLRLDFLAHQLSLIKHLSIIPHSTFSSKRPKHSQNCCICAERNPRHLELDQNIRFPNSKGKKTWDVGWNGSVSLGMISFYLDETTLTKIPNFYRYYPPGLWHVACWKMENRMKMYI